MTRVFTSEQKAKLTNMVNEGIQVMLEIETLQGGMSDTVKQVAQELEVKPAILKRAIRIAYKSRLAEENADHEDLNQILETVGKTL